MAEAQNEVAYWEGVRDYQPPVEEAVAVEEPIEQASTEPATEAPTEETPTAPTESEKQTESTLSEEVAKLNEKQTANEASTKSIGTEIVKIDSKQRSAMFNRISDWLSNENLKKAWKKIEMKSLKNLVMNRCQLPMSPKNIYCCLAIV